MAPEYPPRLVVFTLDGDGESITAVIENVERTGEKSASAQPLRVQWSEITAPPGYRAVGLGALFVKDGPDVCFTDPRPVLLERLQGTRYRWIQGTPPDVPWVMIAVVFPRGTAYAKPGQR